MKDEDNQGGQRLHGPYIEELFAKNEQSVESIQTISELQSLAMNDIKEEIKSLRDLASLNPNNALVIANHKLLSQDPDKEKTWFVTSTFEVTALYKWQIAGIGTFPGTLPKPLGFIFHDDGTGAAAGVFGCQVAGFFVVDPYEIANSDEYKTEHWDIGWVRAGRYRHETKVKGTGAGGATMKMWTDNGRFLCSLVGIAPGIGYIDVKDRGWIAWTGYKK